MSNSFNDILTRLLANVDDSFDKREGSIIYDALAPVAAELAKYYIDLDIYKEQTYLLTAHGDNLDNKIVECGLKRYSATPALVNIIVYDNIGALMEIPVGTRFASPNDFGGNNFIITEEVSVGNYIGQCETLGDAGNKYFGILLPLDAINNLGSAELVSIEEYGENEETDDQLRERALAKLNEEAFSGNIAAYKEFAIALPGIADCKVYPIWNGGGTVKLELLGPNHTILSQSAVADAQNAIDPNPQGTGNGIAPIGHTVTVETPTADEITIKATLQLASSVIISDIEDEVKEEIENYIYQVQDEFVDKDVLIIYIAKVIAAILNVNGIENVTDVKINNVAADYEIDNSLSDPTDIIKYPVLAENGVILQ